MRKVLAIAALAACGGSPAAPAVTPVKPAVDSADPQGSHREAVSAQIQPMIDAELATAIVVGIYDAGKLEIYGFGRGPDGKPPTGRTIFELGAVTKVYTTLLLADSVQRREVDLDTPVSELMPPGVTVPTGNKSVITLKHLALHSSGLPPLPPSINDPRSKDPLRTFTDDVLYADLVRTRLDSAPGTNIQISEYGSGLLGVALGRKANTTYQELVESRIIKALGLTDTFFAVPPEAAPRRVQGTNQELAPVTPWSWGALAGAGALLSSARDQLTLIDAELDAAAGSKVPLRPAMRFTQEPQLEGAGANIGLGWQIDRDGRHWHNGTTNGFHAFVGFDIKQRRGLVVLASSASPIVDQVVHRLYKILGGEQVAVRSMPTPAQLVTYAGTYNFSGSQLKMIADGKRIYVEGPGEPRIRMLPLSDREFWIASQQVLVVFEEDGGKVTRAVFVVGDKKMAAPRIE